MRQDACAPTNRQVRGGGGGGGVHERHTRTRTLSMKCGRPLQPFASGTLSCEGTCLALLRRYGSEQYPLLLGGLSSKRLAEGRTLGAASSGAGACPFAPPDALSCTRTVLGTAPALDARPPPASHHLQRCRWRSDGAHQSDAWRQRDAWRLHHLFQRHLRRLGSLC